VALKLFVGMTDRDWYELLRQLPELDEVNFWACRRTRWPCISSVSPSINGVAFLSAVLPLRAWLESEQLWPVAAQKPTDPKVAVERSLRELRRPRSSSIYRDLAGNVSLDRCTDGAFLRLRALLQMWFPEFAPEHDPSS
jgi:hypothetical protein